MKNYYIVIHISNGKDINLVLEEKIAPLSVNNFVKLINEKYFDGTIFHRVIKDFMIQTGGYKIEDNSLVEAPEIPSIKGEFSSNGVKNDLKHELGVISMARTSDPNSASGQFFICAATCPWLDGSYAAFGHTLSKEDNDVVLEISNVETCTPHPSFADFPCELIGINSIDILKVEDDQ